MIVEERKGNGGSVEFSSLVPCAKSAAFNGHTVEFGVGNTEGNLREFSFERFRTYRRRKHLRLGSESSLQEDGRGSTEAAGQLADQPIKDPQDIILHRNSCEQDGFSRIDSLVLLDGSDDCPPAHWRSVVLEHISHSLGVSEGGVQSCIQEALKSSLFGFTTTSKIDCTSEKSAWSQKSVRCHEDRPKIYSQLHSEPKIPDKSQNAAKHKGANSEGTQNEPNKQGNVHHITELCQRVFFNVIVSEKFALLCKLLCENFQGIKVDSFFDFSVINSRMKEGAYGRSPILFSEDIQQVWHKFQKIGSEMVSLARSLSDISRTSYREQVEGLLHGTREEGKHEIKRHTKPEQVEASGLDKFCTCRQCGAKADGKDCLVCDSCEEMFHVSCIKPAVEEIPLRSWYCANCTATGIESPLHENCVVCERLNVTRTHTHGSGDGTLPMGEEMLSDLDEKSDCSMEARDGLQLPGGSRRLRCCKLCGSGEEDGQKFQICGHPFCPNRYYHLRCLTSQQLKSYGSCWYCPSCLCRGCLVDRDDDKIVLCDGCDHAYHIYCMEPPRTSIPKGKWFCNRCETGIQAIRKAKRVYENLDKQQRKKHSGGSKEAVGSVDMLLNAAEKLKCEEKMVAIARTRKAEQEKK